MTKPLHLRISVSVMFDKRPGREWKPNVSASHEIAFGPALDIDRIVEGIKSIPDPRKREEILKDPESLKYHVLKEMGLELALKVNEALKPLVEKVAGRVCENKTR